MAQIANLSREQIDSVAEAAKERGLLVEGIAGAGAVGVVLRAVDRGCNAKVFALKVLAGPVDSKWSARFQREASILARLDHSGLVRIRPPGLMQLGAFHCFAMDYVEGISLRRWLDENGPLDEEKAVKIGLQICEVVEFVHGERIIHRDLHAGNVMFENSDFSRIKVLDFGTAREIPMANIIDTGGYKTFRPIGSMSHSAPEKWLNPHTAGEESDVFSLGVILYNALTMQFPFWSDSYVKLFELIRRGEFRPANIAANNISQATADTIAAMIEPSKLYRINSMGEASRNLRSLLAGP